MKTINSVPDGIEVLAFHIDGKTWHQVTFSNGYAKMRWNGEYMQGKGWYSHWAALPLNPI